jgi:hypothetical protein
MMTHERRWVGLGGLLLTAVLLTTVFVTPNGPDATAGPAKVVVFAQQNRNALYLNAYLVSLAVAIATAFLWYLREVASPGVAGRRLANLGFAGGLLFLVGGLFSAGTAFAMADVARHTYPSVLQTLNVISQDVDNMAGGATALLLGATSLAILQSGALPRWLAYVGLVLAVASFAVPRLGLLVVAAWWLMTSLVLVVTSKKPTVPHALAASM